MKTAIIGAGWTGLSLAYRLSESVHELTVFEKENQPGGLATYHDYGNFFWDRFYHVILPTDQALIDFITEIGLEHAMSWKQTRTGFFVDRHFYSVSTTGEFLRFPPLNYIQKCRLALTILSGAATNNWKKLEKITVEEWLLRYSGRTVYEKFWKPLLLAKLGDSYKRVSAVFIWTYIKRLFAAREASATRREKMGYIRGGYKTALDHLTARLSGSGVSFRMNTFIEKVTPRQEGGLWILSNGRKEHFDKVVFTGPVSILERVADPQLFSVYGKTSLVEYLGVVCMVLVLRRPLTSYYVLNIADPDIPFTGVIGMSTLVDPGETGGYHLVYLPKYLLSTDPFLRKSDAEVQSLFWEGLRKMYPRFSNEDVVAVHINRAFKVQPLQVLNYSGIIPRVVTRHPDLFVLNTSQFVNNTLNNNSVIQHVNDFVEQYGGIFKEGANQAVIASDT